jgi:hypothetical protein
LCDILEHLLKQKDLFSKVEWMIAGQEECLVFVISGPVLKPALSFGSRQS